MIEGSGNELGSIEKIPFIPLAIDTKKKINYINNMLHNWMHDNLITVNREIVNSGTTQKIAVNALSSYKIVNIPPIIALSINRFNNKQQRINTSINIQKGINPYKNTTNDRINNITLNGIHWNIHSIVCHRGNTPKSGHYYSILYNDKKKAWYMFDDLKIPSMKQVFMSDKNIINLVKKDCVFLIYKLI